MLYFQEHPIKHQNIAEVSIEVENKNKEGPIQYRELEQIQVRRKIEKDKGSKFYINDKVRARDAQMFLQIFHWCSFPFND